MKKKKIKKSVIAAAALLIVCVLVYTVKPIYYRVYPFDRFTVNYTVSYNGERVRCEERYYSYEDEKTVVPGKDRGKFKIRGSKYGTYDIGFIVRSKALYIMADYDEIFLALEPFDFKFNYFNTNWWHITDMHIYIDFLKIDGEWYADCKQVITEPDVDESGRTHTDTYECRVLLKDVNNYDYLPLSDANG
ncbi:MAG: hypothetical protein IIU80_02195 [Clostridia bacterium]|nr:hypothetical protein [Clostridia bacterium]